MKILVMLALVFSSVFAFAKPSKNLGMKVRIQDAQAKDLFFLLEKKGAKREGSSIITYTLDNVVCTGINSHGENAREGFSCDIAL